MEVRQFVHSSYEYVEIINKIFVHTIIFNK